MAKSKKSPAKKTAVKKSAKKAPAKVSKSASKEKTFGHWGLVSMNNNEAYIHIAFDSPITKKNLKKWSEGYLAAMLEAKAMVLNESIFNDWEIEKVEFKREDKSFREQDYPFWVGKDEVDQIYNEIVKLNRGV